MRILLGVSALAIIGGAALADPVQPRGDAPPAVVQPRAPSDGPNARDALPSRPCDEEGLRRANQSSARVSRLGHLPTADMHLLVRRRVNGCSVQTIVVRDVEASITLRGR
jgi:hypothetical protein